MRVALLQRGDAKGFLTIDGKLPASALASLIAIDALEF